MRDNDPERQDLSPELKKRPACATPTAGWELVTTSQIAAPDRHYEGTTIMFATAPREPTDSQSLGTWYLCSSWHEREAPAIRQSTRRSSQVAQAPGNLAPPFGLETGSSPLNRALADDGSSRIELRFELGKRYARCRRPRRSVGSSRPGASSPSSPRSVRRAR